MKLFVIKDTKANYYMQPQLYRTSAEAVRACSNSVNDKNNGLFAKNAEDFVLFEIGEWDEQTGNISPCDKKHIADMIDLRQPTE